MSTMSQATARKIIKEMRELEKDLIDRLATVRSKITEAQLALLPFKIGDVVEAKFYGARDPWVVVKIENIRFRYGGDNPTIYVRTRNKDGSFHKSTRDFYAHSNYENIRPLSKS